jgi:adenine-specific DNA methylase
MKLSKIEIANFRCFEKLPIDLPADLAVLVGNNGAGKSAILEGMAYALSRVLTRLPQIEGKQLRPEDIRIGARGVQAPFVRVEAESTEGTRWTRTLKRDPTRQTAADVPDAIGDKALFEFLDPTIHAIAGGQNATLPVFAFYGVSRAVLDIPERRRNFRKEFRRFDALDNALEPTTRFKDLFEWFYAQERDEMERITQAILTPEFQAWLKSANGGPPKFAGKAPVNPDSRKGQLDIKTWKGAQGLAEDVRYYGQWMRDEAEKRIGHLYPKIEITAEMVRERPDLKTLVGQRLAVIAWLWARTVKSPNPAFREVDVPLASTFMLSTKPGKEAYVEPVLEKAGYQFSVKVGTPLDAAAAKNGTKLARGANFRGVMSGTPIAGDYIKTEGKAGRMGARLMAIVAEGPRGRLYLSPNLQQECVASSAEQADAQQQTISTGRVVSTDPPYYDNVPYADISDYFYVWMRRTLRIAFPNLFGTLSVPKAEELVAFVYRHNDKCSAEVFFLNGMTHAMRRLAEQAHVAFPVTIYYAFKQSETSSSAGTASARWETFLEAVIQAGFGTSGTWPMRTENDSRMVGHGTNALASSIVLVCRPREAEAPTATRREFVAALQRELPEALRQLQAGNIAPVDLAQAAIGPGMAVFTRYAKVLDAQGKPLTVREALALINETLDTALAEQEGDFDPDRWALAWFEQFGFEEGEFGVAETLSKAKNTSVQGLEEAGILKQGRGKVRILKPDELPADWDWDPTADDRLTNWETMCWPSSAMWKRKPMRVFTGWNCWPNRARCQRAGWPLQ